jgi:hypothetical protein
MAGRKTFKIASTLERFRHARNQRLQEIQGLGVNPDKKGNPPMGYLHYTA